MNSCLSSFLRIVVVCLFTTLTILPAVCTCETPPDAKTQREIAQLRKRAEKGDVQKQLELAGDYLTGHGVPQDPTLAAHWYRKAAGAGDADAQNQIAYLYEHGIGVPVDRICAFHWYQLASASGSLHARVNLGIAYLTGMGTLANPSAARQLFREAAEKGSGLGAAYLGDIYFLGFGVPKDVVEAESWFNIGVRLHDPVAAFDMANLLTDDPSHPHDVPRAAELLRFAVSKGYVPAIHALGRMLINHPELDQSPRDGAALLQEGSLAGSWKSSVLLGVLARDGHSVPADPTQASYYFHLAELQGGEQARRLVAGDLAALASQLTPQQDSASATQAAAWFQQHAQQLLYVLDQKDSQSHFPLAAFADSGEESQSGR